jgi:uncharacterized protein (TIGR02270 family)
VQDALRAQEPQLLEEAMAAGLALGLDAAWAACRRATSAPGDACRFSLGALATSRDPSDRAVVVERTREPRVRRHALWALDFVGDLDAAEALIEALADQETTKIAGEAFAAITGCFIQGALIDISETTAANRAEVADDDPPPVVRSEDLLPLPALENVKSWWTQHRASFRRGVRYVHGQPRNAETLRAALMTATMWRRELLQLELATSATNVSLANLTTWAHDQQRQLPSAPGAPRQ